MSEEKTLADRLRRRWFSGKNDAPGAKEVHQRKRLEGGGGDSEEWRVREL